MSSLWKRLAQSTLLQAFLQGGSREASLLLAHPKLVTLVLQQCAEKMAVLSCTAPCGFPSSVGIRQQSLSPTVVAMFTDTILAKTSSVLEQKKPLFSPACFYNFAFFLMLTTLAVVL